MELIDIRVANERLKAAAARRDAHVDPRTPPIERATPSKARA